MFIAADPDLEFLGRSEFFSRGEWFGEHKRFCDASCPL